MARRKASAAHRQFRVERGGTGGMKMVTSTCTTCGKARYATKGDAKTAVSRMSGGTAHYYRCGNYWHYTSMTAEQVAAIRAADREGEIR
jgi:hypothetical protein